MWLVALQLACQWIITEQLSPFDSEDTEPQVVQWIFLCVGPQKTEALNNAPKRDISVSLTQRFSFLESSSSCTTNSPWSCKAPFESPGRGSRISVQCCSCFRPSFLFSPPQLVRMSSPGFHPRWWGLGHCHSTFYAPGHLEWTGTESVTGSRTFSVPLTQNLKYKKYRRYQVLKYLPQFSWFNILIQKAASKSSMPCVFWILYLKYFKISNE